MVRSTVSTEMAEKEIEEKERGLESECETKINIKSEPDEDTHNSEGVFDTNKETLRSDVSIIKIKIELEDEGSGLEMNIKSEPDKDTTTEAMLDTNQAKSQEIEVNLPTKLDIEIKCEPMEHLNDSNSCSTDNIKTDSVDIKTNTGNLSTTGNNVLIKSEVDTGKNGLQTLDNTNSDTEFHTKNGQIEKTTDKIEIEIDFKHTNEKLESVLNTETENSNISKELTHKKQCNICKKQFKRTNHLTTHLRTHTGERPYECDICKMRFKQETHLTLHLSTHTGEKPYECEICKKRFVRKLSLTDHLRTHSGERPFECGICKKHFKQKAHLRTHLDTQHNNKRSYECEICKKQFRQKSYLTYHLTTHTEERNQCKICKKRFIQKVNFIKHMHTIHSGEISEVI